MFSSLRTHPSLLPRSILTSNLRLATPFSFSRSYASPSLSLDQDHYANLGVSNSATRKQIKDKFYELSRKYHPDAPSTSSMTPEQRTERFQQISQSYSILSDPNSRKSYDLSRGGPGSPSHRRSRTHAGYTRGSGGMGYAAGGYSAQNSASGNEERRQSANYAWQHPQRGRAGAGASQRSSAEEAAQARADPFSQRAGRGDDHLMRFAKRAARLRTTTMGAGTAGGTAGRVDEHYQAGTAVFGRKKAEEESRLINDSSTLRSSQVLFVFGSVFVVAWLFSGGHDRHEQTTTTTRRRVA
ncbi:J domain-containing protein [Sporobolomyces salmoneus]|uniref:J domain-containing protein n=1 Tax=Sporobolomyces salmoneus TaxID=183962 RepID=UPI00316C4A7A